MNPHEYIALTFRGLEGVLAKEIADLGGSDIRTGQEMVRFTGDKTLLYKANIHLRTALKVLCLFVECKATNPDEVYDALISCPWEDVLTGKQTFNIQTEVQSELFKNSSLVGYKVKDAITAHMEGKSGKRPSVSLTNPDLYIYTHVLDDRCIISIDSSGEPLSNRGYRTAPSESATNEVLAAGLLLLAGWDGQSNFVDPMCGSGTLLIEAALIAFKIPPGIYRKGFAFEKWSDFDPEILEHLLNDETEERPFTFKIMGSDISPMAIATAESTIKNASLTNRIELRNLSIQKRDKAPLPGLVVTVPPAGERMRSEDLLALFGQIGERLKHVFTGYNAWVLSSREDAFEQIGLRASERFGLRINNQEYEFRRYEMFKGTPTFADPYSKNRR